VFATWRVADFGFGFVSTAADLTRSAPGFKLPPDFLPINLLPLNPLDLPLSQLLAILTPLLVLILLLFLLLPVVLPALPAFPFLAIAFLLLLGIRIQHGGWRLSPTLPAHSRTAS
jgi:hypothetical protein